MIYTLILPSCNTETIELCTYYIVIEPSNTHTLIYELSVYNNKNNISTDSRTPITQLNVNFEDIKLLNSTCIYSQFYGIKASLTDFPIGIIVQPEFIDTDALFIINEFTSSPNTQINTKQINKLKCDAVSESYGIPSLKGYIIYSQSNISYIQLSVINSGGWFLMLILVFLILIAMCRKHDYPMMIYYKIFNYKIHYLILIICHIIANINQMGLLFNN